MHNIPSPHRLLDDIEHFLKTSVLPNAQQADVDSVTLAKLFTQYQEQKLLTLLIPKTLGGLGITESDFKYYRIMMAKHSGALTLLQAQHQIAVEKLNAVNTYKAHELLQTIVQNNKTLAYFNISKHNSDQCKIRRSTDYNLGFRLTGLLPWVTGLHFMDDLFIQFFLDNTVYYALIPFKDTAIHDGRLTCGHPLPLSIFSSTNTVQVTLDNWLIQEEDIITSIALKQQTKTNKPHNSVYSFAGCTQAALNQVICSRSNTIQHSYLAIKKRLDNYMSVILADTTDINARQLRATGYRLTVDATELARLSCTGKALLNDHPIQRLSKELWQYAIAGIEDKQLDAYLENS